jgi:beta-N-acetylhexosaminidase
MRQMMHSFHGLSAPKWVLDGVAAGEITAFCLFGYNVESPEQVRRLCESLIHAATSKNLPPPIIGIDQEGGQLIAVAKGATELPGNMALGATQSPELAAKAGYVLARELLAMGINLNFAPSIDVNNNPDNPVIGIRSFGEDPELVGRLGAALISSMQANGVVATAKHFPGHGDAAGDTHYAAPVVQHSLSHIEDIELKPFRMAIEAGVGAIMSSHLLYTAFDDKNPATLSYAIMHELLREDMGFQGIAMTDAMDMHAVSRLGGAEAVRQALLAGSDLILLGHLPQQAAIAAKFKHLERVESIARIDAMRQAIATELLPFEIIGSAEHRAIAQEIADASMTLSRNENGLLPLRLNADESLAVITALPENLTPADTSSLVTIRLSDAITKRHENTLALTMPLKPSAEEISSILERLGAIETVVVGTISAEVLRGQSQLVNELLAAGKRVIAIALRTPYDIMAYPEVDAYLCTYGIRDASTEAAAKVLFGEIAAKGVLPCKSPIGETNP